MVVLREFFRFARIAFHTSAKLFGLDSHLEPDIT